MTPERSPSFSFPRAWTTCGAKLSSGLTKPQSPPCAARESLEWALATSSKGLPASRSASALRAASAPPAGSIMIIRTWTPAVSASSALWASYHARTFLGETTSLRSTWSWRMAWTMRFSRTWRTHSSRVIRAARRLSFSLASSPPNCSARISWTRALTASLGSWAPEAS